MKKELIYILKRVIIGVLIAIILFSIKSCQVKALEIGASTYALPDNAVFYNNISVDNSTAVTTDFNVDSYENRDLIRTVPNNQGGNGASICIAPNFTLKSGNIYSISILMANNHAAAYNIVTKDNYTFVRAGYSAQDAANRKNSITIQYFNSNYVPNMGYGPAYALIYMVTIVGGNYNYICLPFTTNTDLSSTHAFYGVSFDLVGNANDITQSDMQTYINNLNTNIVNNNNNNRDLIINNQNYNTQLEIESQEVCDEPSITIDSTNYNNFYSGYINNTGAIVEENSSNYVHTKFIRIYKEGEYSITTTMTNGTLGNYLSYCLFNKNKIKINCYNYNNISPITNVEGYIMFSGYRYANVTFSGHVCRNGNQAIENAQQETNQQLQDLNDNLTSEASPNLSSLNNSAGWLPAGPVDSILNLPLALLNNINTNLSKSCQPVILHIPLVDRDLPIPCITTLYEQMGIMTWVNTIGAIASAFILFTYFVKLYKWVDDTLTFRENNYIDNWGGV